VELETQESSPPNRNIAEVAENLFRTESGKLVSVLTGIFGVERFGLAEDVVQEALVRALQTWPYYGIPPNPAAWLTQTAKNLAIDVIRREKSFREKQPAIVATAESHVADKTPPEVTFPSEIRDDQLRLMFVCCHPALPVEVQVALALKTLGGFSPAEIARAFLTSEAAIAKRLTRARQKIRDERIPFEIPAGDELHGRIDAVLHALHLLFNEGYKASTGPSLIREELCREAIRLAELLVEHPAGNLPKAHALLAVMLLHAARLPARVDQSGSILLLKDQDRSQWDRTKMAKGIWHLAQSSSGTQLDEYHLEAGIAACHTMAADYESTDWKKILSLYDEWIRMSESPVVALNRCVALSKVNGAVVALKELSRIKGSSTLQDYYLLFAVEAELEQEVGNRKVATELLQKALALTGLETEREFLREKIRQLQN
jgi:RNA polymerase sigma-70 factor (ECF subfamily)